MKLKEMINEKKFKKDMIDFGCSNKDSEEILMVLDSCRKEIESPQSVTELLNIVAGDDVLMLFSKEDAEQVRKFLRENKIAFIERVRK